MQTGQQVIDEIRAKTDTVFLSFSCGKDSIVAWIELKKHFKRIIPYYLYLVPNLSFVNDALDYYEKYFGQKIYRYPHPSVFRLLENMVFQAPENCHKIEESALYSYEYSDVTKWAADDAGYTGPVWYAVGVRSADSPMRRATIKKYGAINYKKQSFYPVHDWNIDKLKHCLRHNNCKLPIDYKLFGRSFDGIDYRFVKPIKDNLPKDYEKIKELFPLVELEILRREYHEKHRSV